MAAAIVAEINATTWTPAVTASRVWVSQTILTTHAGIVVDVVPVGSTLELMGRIQSMRTVRVSVRVVKKLPHPSAVSDVDPVADLIEAIGEHFLRLRLPTLGNALVTAVEDAPPDQDAIEQEGLAVGVCTLTVEVEL